MVRHGQAQPKKGWRGPDDGRPLVARGRRQAHRLDKVVGSGRPARFISSPARRCRQTVEPLAARYGMGVELSESLATGAGPQAVALCQKVAASEPHGSTVVLCTHREVLEVMLPLLVGDAGRRLPHPLPGAKGGAWSLYFEAGRLVEVGYHPPAA